MSRGNATAARIVVDPNRVACAAPQQPQRARGELFTIDIAIQTVDVKLQNKIVKNAGIRVVLGDAFCIKPSSREARNHGLNTLSARARATLGFPEIPRNILRTMKLFWGQSLMPIRTKAAAGSTCSKWSPRTLEA